MNAASSFPSAAPVALIALKLSSPMTLNRGGRRYVHPLWAHVRSRDLLSPQAGWIVKTAEELGLDNNFVLAAAAAFEHAWHSDKRDQASRDDAGEYNVAITRVICAWYRRRAALAAWAANNRA